MNNYCKEFNINPTDVRNEVRRIRIEKRTYDEYGAILDVGPVENYAQQAGRM